MILFWVVTTVSANFCFPPVNPEMLSKPLILLSAAGGMDMGGMNPSMMTQGFQPGQDAYKIFLSEAENLELTTHEWLLDDIEERILSKYV